MTTAELDGILAKIKPLSEMEDIVRQAREDGKTVALANGCFDMLHVGHVRYLRGAAEHADVLLVGINSDSSVQALKGDGRPLIGEKERMMMIAAMECVDYVILFTGTRVDEILLTLKPDFHAKGTDYTEDTVPEKDVVASYGGKVIITGDPKDHSSSGVIRSIKDNSCS